MYHFPEKRAVEGNCIFRGLFFFLTKCCMFSTTMIGEKIPERERERDFPYPAVLRLT